MKILVVENDKQLADTFKEFFEFYGHHCEIATNRNAAIMLLSAKKFNTIVADLPLSDFDCRSFVFNILANYPDKKVKVFVISNMDLTSDDEKILKDLTNATVFRRRSSLELLLEKIS